MSVPIKWSNKHVLNNFSTALLSKNWNCTFLLFCIATEKRNFSLSILAVITEEFGLHAQFSRLHTNLRATESTFWIMKHARVPADLCLDLSCSEARQLKAIAEQKHLVLSKISKLVFPQHILYIDNNSVFTLTNASECLKCKHQYN